MKKILFLASILICSLAAQSQKLQEQMFFYNPKGMTYIPPLKRPAIVFDGKLFIGKKKLNGLFSYVDNPELTRYFKKYKANKTAADVLYITSAGLAIFSAINWGKQGNFPWLTVVPAFVASGTSGYLNIKAQQNLMAAAIRFQQWHDLQKSMGFVPQQRNISIAIPLNL